MAFVKIISIPRNSSVYSTCFAFKQFVFIARLYSGTMTIVNQDAWQAQDAMDGSRTSLDLGTILRSSFQLPANTLTGTVHPGMSQASLRTKISRVGSNHETAANAPRAPGFNNSNVSRHPLLNCFNNIEGEFNCHVGRI